jgi:hypothetical protein
MHQVSLPIARKNIPVLLPDGSDAISILDILIFLVYRTGRSGSGIDDFETWNVAEKKLVRRASTV